MKPIGKVILTSLIFSTPAFATVSISNFNQLVQAVEQGDNVEAIVHIGGNQCVPQTVNNTIQAKKFSNEAQGVTRINFDVFSHYKVTLPDNSVKDTVATSFTMHIEHPGLGLLEDYGRLRVFADGTAEFHAAYYDPVSNQKKIEMNWLCHYGQPNDGLVLFDKG